MPMRLRVQAVALATVLTSAAACVSSDFAGPTIPSNAVVYVMSSKSLPLLSYRFVDTSSAQHLIQTALTDSGLFAGMNCIGLVPNGVGDSVGTFVFATVGSNLMALKEFKITGTPPDTVNDTIPVSFLPPTTEGTHGGYLVKATGALTLTWADGTPTQYFAPTAVLTLHGDTISSHAELSAKADSVHASWHVSWLRDVCPQ